jgi:hypothetical protein
VGDFSAKPYDLIAHFLRDGRFNGVKAGRHECSLQA